MRQFKELDPATIGTQSLRFNGDTVLQHICSPAALGGAAKTLSASRCFSAALHH